MSNPFFDEDVLFDSHCHLNSDEFQEDRQEVLATMVESGVEKVIDVAVDIKSARRSAKQAKQFPEQVYSTIGIHPEKFVPGSDMYNKNFDERYIDEQIQLLRVEVEGGQYVAIGECGIDLYWLEKNNVSRDIFEKSRKYQRDLFELQVMMAQKFSLPLTIHARNSLDDCLDILKKYSGEVEAIMHSFTGDYSEAKKILDFGFYLGVNGIATYKSAL